MHFWVQGQLVHSQSYTVKPCWGKNTKHGGWPRRNDTWGRPLVHTGMGSSVCALVCKFQKHCSKLYLSGMYVDSHGIQMHCTINLLLFSEWGREDWGLGYSSVTDYSLACGSEFHPQQLSHWDPELTIWPYLLASEPQGCTCRCLPLLGYQAQITRC